MMTVRPVTLSPIAPVWRALQLALCLSGLAMGRPASGQPADFTTLMNHLSEAQLRVETSQEKAGLAQRDSRVDPRLWQLFEASRSKSLAALSEKAFELSVPYAAGSVAVRLTPEYAGEQRALIKAVATSGGTVTTTLGHAVYAELPVANIEHLGDIRELGFAAPQARFFPSAFQGKGAVVSEGVQLTHVSRFHQAGITGKGVKIGVLDFGFMRYAELVQTGEVPRPRAQRAFNAAGRLEANTVHGTACAEIIHDMAPQAELSLAAVEGREDQIVQAAEWLAQQDVDIISFSGGGVFGPRNGRSPLDRLVDKIVSRYGILWVNAAGNEASGHWLGMTVDNNRNGWIDVAENREDVIAIQSGGTEMTVLVTWDDWGNNPDLPAASQDIDTYLAMLDPVTQQWAIVTDSTHPQRGRGPPVEALGIRTRPGQIFALLLKAARVNRDVSIHAFIRGAAEIQPAVARGSIAIPATSPKALAVGAVDVQTGQLEPYSSQGPTDDARLKPEVSAPDKNTSASYGQSAQSGAFPGTSAACPHVSGYAALFKQQEPQLSVEELRRVVIRHVRAMGSPVPNNQFGYGHIDARKVRVAGQDRESTPPEQRSEEDRMRVLEPILDLLK